VGATNDQSVWIEQDEIVERDCFESGSRGNLELRAPACSSRDFDTNEGDESQHARQQWVGNSPQVIRRASGAHGSLLGRAVRGKQSTVPSASAFRPSKLITHANSDLTWCDELLT
jgi:hypothetical protein